MVMVLDNVKNEHTFSNFVFYEIKVVEPINNSPRLGCLDVCLNILYLEHMSFLHNHM
jgi:hypothetical protein